MVMAKQMTCRDEALTARLLTTQELCAELSVAVCTLWVWRQAGMPYVSLGTRMVRYNLPDVLEWLEERKTASRAS